MTPTSHSPIWTRIGSLDQALEALQCGRVDHLQISTFGGSEWVTSVILAQNAPLEQCFEPIWAPKMIFP